MKLLRRLWCLVVGHQPWRPRWPVGEWHLLEITEHAAPLPQRMTVDICARCHELVGRVMPWPP